MYRSALALFAVACIAVSAENAICEQLIECLAKARAKNNECLSFHASATDTKHECRNETLHDELKELTEERTTHYETCLRAKAPSAGAIESGKKKAKCEAILKKNPTKRDSHPEEKKARRTKKEKKSANLQKQCFREARKIKLQCSQLAKCCTVSKQCRDTSEIDEKISAKKIDIKEAQQQCRAEHGKKSSRKQHKHHGGHRKKTTTTEAPQK